MAATLLAHQPVRSIDIDAFGTVKPLLRGRLHQLCAVGSVGAGWHLVERAAPGGERVTAIVFAVTWTLMFTTSAAYHRLARTPTEVRWMRRADHSMIFVHIAGALTPLLLLGLSGSLAVVTTGLAWVLAGAGVAIKMARLTETNPAGAWLYPVLGWFPVPLLPALAPALGASGLFALAAGGVAYTVGAACFARKWPDPVPRIFGYHEVWHVFTLVGGVFQFAVTVELVS